MSSPDATRPQGSHRKSRGGRPPLHLLFLPRHLAPLRCLLLLLCCYSPPSRRRRPPPPPPPPPQPQKGTPPPPGSARSPRFCGFSSAQIRPLLSSSSAPEIRCRRRLCGPPPARSALKRVIFYWTAKVRLLQAILVAFVVSTSLSCLAIQHLGPKDA